MSTWVIVGGYAFLLFLVLAVFDRTRDILYEVIELRRRLQSLEIRVGNVIAPMEEDQRELNRIEAEAEASEPRRRKE